MENLRTQGHAESALLFSLPTMTDNSANDEWHSAVLEWLSTQFPEAQCCYVSEHGDDHSGNGSLQAPYHSIRHALTTLKHASVEHPLFLLLSGTLEAGVAPIVPHVHYIGLGSHCRIVGDLVQDPTWSQSTEGGVTYLSNLTVDTLLFQTRSIPISVLYLMGMTINQRLQLSGHVTAAQCYLNDCVVYGVTQLDNAVVYSSANHYCGTVHLGFGAVHTYVALYSKQDRYLAKTAVILTTQAEYNSQLRLRQSQIQGEVIAKGHAHIVTDRSSYATPHLQGDARITVMGESVLADRALSRDVPCGQSVLPKILYQVAPHGDDAQGIGSVAAPFASLGGALRHIAQHCPEAPCAIQLYPGEYTEYQDVCLLPGVSVLGNQSTVRIHGGIYLGADWSNPQGMSLLRDLTLMVSDIIELDFRAFSPQPRLLVWENVEFLSDTPCCIKGTGQETILFSGVDAIQFQVGLQLQDVQGKISDCFLDSLTLVNTGNYEDTVMNLCDSTIFLTTSAKAHHKHLTFNISTSVLTLGLCRSGKTVFVSMDRVSGLDKEIHYQH